MAGTTVFLDTFTGASGVALSAHAPEIGSWVGVYDSEYVKLDGAGFAHYPGDSHEPGVPAVQLDIPLGAHPAEININSTATFKVTNLSVIDGLFSFVVELVGDGDSHGLAAVVFHDGGGVGRIDITALGPYTSTSLTFPLTANEEFTIELISNAGPASKHTLNVYGPGWAESASIEGVLVEDPSMELSAKLAFLDNSRVKVGSLSVATEALGSAVASPAAMVSIKTPLGIAMAVGDIEGVTGRSSVGSPLSGASSVAAHDFTHVLGDAPTIYLVDLITAGGVVRVPASSWQATLQTLAKCYVQAVIPASAEHSEAINDATEFVVSRAGMLPSGLTVEVEMARAPLTSAQFDRGPMRETCTISGYADAFAVNEDASPASDRVLTGIRSISSGTGGTRVRCGIDWLLRPSQRAIVNGVTITADYINYYVPRGFDAYMDVGERA